MFRLPLILGVSMFVAALGLSPVSTRAADPVAPPAAQPNKESFSLLGLTRDDVISLRGKPSGERRRGDELLLVYPDGTRVELRGGVVTAVSGGAAAAGGEIVGADGTRYVPGVDGNIQRPVTITEPDAPGQEAASVPEDASVAPAEPDPRMDEADIDGLERTAPVDLEAVGAIEQHLEQAGQPPIGFGGEQEKPPVVLQIVGFIFSALVRFGLAVLILRLVFHFMGVPFFWPDLLKVALLYLAVHEVLSALGELDGLWEFVRIFKLPDVVSFVVLACSLTWFKIAGNGITALRIAVAAKIAIYALMMGVAFLVLLGMAALR